MFGIVRSAARAIRSTRNSVRCRPLTIVLRRYGDDQTKLDDPPPASNVLLHVDTPTLSPSVQHAQRQLNLVQQILGLRDREKRGLDQEFTDAVFICVDCEAYERAQYKITEIGVAVLDTRNLQHLLTGLTAESLTAQIKSSHFRASEHARLVNRKFVKGREDHFNFGYSYWVKKGDYAQVLRRAFASPTELDHAATFDTELSTDERNIILIGHGLKGDIDYMSQAGFDIQACGNIAHRIDTQLLAAAATQTWQIALRRLLQVLDIKATNLHNAGNDAFYTLQALVTMAIMDHTEPGSVLKTAEAFTRPKASTCSV